MVWSVVSKDLTRINNEIKIDIRDHPAGIYHLQIITEKGILNRKIINQ
ncbi:hypothetical protein JYU16_00545 [bacterium AH-315-M05]|nr:hypothetical protein [bacterium AH-315-M05]